MPDYIVKVKNENGDLLQPITISCDDEAVAISQVREHPYVDVNATITVKPVRDDVMRKAFGSQPKNELVVRVDWTWAPNGDASPSS